MKIKIMALLLMASMKLAAQNTFPDNGNAGVGTTLPQGKLEVVGNFLMRGYNIDSRFTTTGNLSYLANSGKLLIGWNRSEGLGETSFVANQGEGNYGGFSFYNYNNQQQQTSLMLLRGDGNVGIGTMVPQEKLSVNGKIRAKEIKVEMANWPDYVFKPDYQAMTLPEIEKYVKANGHLPEVPAASEVEREGVALGEMNKILLKKIEELTLHLIEKDKREQEQQGAIEKMKRQMQELQNQIKGLIK
ncbi:hypothetical protein ACUN24_15115 [Pedobacter sp. WC2501]|uniref:hypothetical protein n=1 Tax=Pedobacter sp. WC2501 TaxID=3461400 RepID=UPI0040452431